MFFIGSHHYHHREPWTLDSLVTRLELPSEPLREILVLLEKAGFVEPTASEPPGFLPARDIATIHIGALLGAVRRAGEADLLQLHPVHTPEPVDRVVDKVRSAVADELGDLTLRDMVLEEAGSLARVRRLDGPGRLSS